MDFANKIFRRATVRGIADYLLYGTEADEDEKDYDARLEAICQKYEEAVYRITNQENSKLIDLANEMTSEVAVIYAELGFQAGILFMQDIFSHLHEK